MKYLKLLIYYELIKYLQKDEEILNKLGLSRNRKQYLRKIIKFYILSTIYKSQLLRFIKNIEIKSIYLIEAEISRYLHATYKNHDYHVVTLTLNYLIDRAY